MAKGSTGGQSGQSGQPGSPGSSSGSSSSAFASSSSTGQRGKLGTNGSSSQSSADGQSGSSGGKSDADSLAKTRGRDWGLPDSTHSAVAISRPVFVECRADSLVILRDDRTTVEKEIPLPSHTQDSVDELVSSVWEHMKGWGSAGKGLFWRPMLVVDVKPGAADRYADLAALLSDSGLEIKQRQAAAIALPPPKKSWFRK
jgi:hypothetical protein